MRDYHRKNCDISRDVYYQVKGILMGYDRLKKEWIDLLYGSQYTISGMPGAGNISDPTAHKAERLSVLGERLEAIDQAAVLMRGERGDQVHETFDPVKAYWSYDYFNCQHRRTKDSPNGPCRRTWNNYKDRFSAVIAQKLKIV